MSCTTMRIDLKTAIKHAHKPATSNWGTDPGASSRGAAFDKRELEALLSKACPK
jgi:hypothetical protein